MPAITAKFPDVRVLIVEDNPLNQQLLTAMLELMRCEVTVASDGKEGASLYQQEEFDIVLMDILMPIMDGFETTKVIRNFESISGRRVPIVAITALAMPDDKQKCLDAGMDDYLSKPIRSNELENIFHKYAAGWLAK